MVEQVLAVARFPCTLPEWLALRRKNEVGFY